MKIKSLHQITFDTEETIKCASLTNSNEWVMLMSSGDVIRYKVDEPSGKYLFSVTSQYTLEDGGFDINAPSTIYTLDLIVVIVNDYKIHGYIHYPEKYQKLHLQRVDYYGSISYYPISLYKNPKGVPHIIFGASWNHLQIMNLDTRQILTASKSLIEKNAEENHINFYKNHTEDNKLPWPRPYDYFFGKLHLSLDHKKFISAGWSWGSSDTYNLFDIDDFITNNRITYQNIGSWEHDKRAICWVDENTVAITYDPRVYDYATLDSPCEIHIYQLTQKKPFIERKIKVPNVNIVETKIHFSKSLNAFIIFSENIGTIIVSQKGIILFQDPTFIPDEYYSDLNSFIITENKTISVFEITE